MAQVKISELPSASSLTGSEVLPIVQGGSTLAATVNQIKDKIQASAINVLKMNASSVQTLANIGELAFNPDTQTLEVKCSADVTLSIGQENYIRGKNAESSTILNGTVVYVSGGLGANSLIKRAGNADVTAERVIGVATQDIGANNIGFITTSGIVNKLNTSAYVEGDLLWLGTNGAMTNVKPNTTVDQICIGVVLRSHAMEGSILVAVKDDWRDKLAEVRSDLNEAITDGVEIGVYSVIKSGSDILNTSFGFSNIEKGAIYRFFIKSSDNNISDVGITFLYNDYTSHNSIVIKPNENGLLKTKDDFENCVCFIQNEETIVGTDTITIGVYKIKESSNTERILELKTGLEELNLIGNGQLLGTYGYTKSGSDVLNTTQSLNLDGNTSYKFVAECGGIVNNIGVVILQGDGAIAKTLNFDTINRGSVILTPTVGISEFYIQNTDAIIGTDKITVSVYKVLDNSIDKEIAQSHGLVGEVDGKLLGVFTYTRTDAAILNEARSLNIIGGRNYKFIAKKVNNDITRIGVVILQDNGHIAKDIVFGNSNTGSVVMSPAVNQNDFYIQNTEDIATSPCPFIVEVYEVANSSIESRIVDIEKNHNVNAAITLHHTEIGDYRYFNIKHVGVGQEYASPMEAISSISDASETNRYIIMLHDDVTITDFTAFWNEAGTERCSSDIILNGTTQYWCYITTKNYVDIIGANRQVKIKIDLPLIALGHQQVGYVHAVIDRGNCRIANIELDVNNVRYCIHQENGSGSYSGPDANTEKVYRNIKMIHRGTADFNQALGVGIAPNQNVLVENCDMASLYSNAWGCHSHSNYAYGAKWRFRNCRCYSGGNNFKNCGYTDIYSGVKSVFTFEGCSFDYFMSKRVAAAFDLELTDKAHDYRNGGIFLSGHGNKMVMGRENAPCLVFETANNNSNISAVSADIVGDCLISYAGTSDAHGIFVGTELIISSESSRVLNLGARLGDCSINNKTLVVTMDNTPQTVTFNQDYTNMSDDSILAVINTALSGCTCYIGYDLEIMSFGDESIIAKNSGTTTIEIGDLVINDYANGFNCYKKCSEGEIADGVASCRINPSDNGKIIIKGHQRFDNIGGLSTFTDGAMYGADNNGKIKVVIDNDSAIFKCIGNNVLVWK